MFKSLSMSLHDDKFETLKPLLFRDGLALSVSYHDGSSQKAFFHSREIPSSVESHHSPEKYGSGFDSFFILAWPNMARIPLSGSWEKQKKMQEGMGGGFMRSNMAGDGSFMW